MLRRYELTDDEWNRIVDLLPPENTGKQGRPRKNNRTILNPYLPEKLTLKKWQFVNILEK